MDSNVLGELLAAELGARWGTDGVPPAIELQPAISAAWTRARSAWPELPVDAGAFVAHVAQHLPRADTVAALGSLHAEDLYLALGCARQDPDALSAFDRLHAADLSLAVSRVRGSAPNAEDVRQLVWQRLFVGDAERRPKILEYSGQGRLQGWFRVALVRALLDEQRRQKGDPVPSEDDRVLGLAAPERDPELEYLRRLYTHEFRQAFEQAARSLDAEDRNALRAYYVSQLTVDQLAAMLGLHRATAARRVASARERLMSETRKRLMARLQLSRGELESVMRLIESGLHVSMHRVLD